MLYHSTRRHFLHLASLASAGLATTPAYRAQATAQGTDALVQTPLGQLRGERRNGIQVFRGIPFAEPPIGDLRFRAPVPKRPWTGARDATHFAAASLQQGDRDLPQSEDCLYLNLWAPDPPPSAARLPVFVWIHGGGFTGGTSFAPIFDGTVFARQGIIVVTVAYRLGVFGFLDLDPLLGPDFAGSANNAPRDLIVALQWVQTNIGSFGGDPTRVTIGGESAGAKLADLLMGVPLAHPLFSGVISESGGAERIWPKNIAQNVAQGFGRDWTSRSGKAVADLRSAPARQLIDAQTAFLKVWPQHFPLRCELDRALFPNKPIESIRAGSVRGKRLLIGTNRDESALFLGAHPAHNPTAADLGNMPQDEFNTVLAQYRTIYPSLSEERLRIAAATAEEYWVPSVRVADAAADAGAKVWMYRLDFARTGGPYKGLAFHSEDLALVWNKPSHEFESSKAEATLSASINAAWAAFIKGESPAAAGLPPWPEYNSKTRPNMLLDTISNVENEPKNAELQLWSGHL